MQTIRYIYILLIFILLFTLNLSAETFILGTGYKNKGYYILGQSIKKTLQDNNFSDTIIIKETSGSTENLEKLSNGEIDLAIVQSDTAFYAENGKNIFYNHKVDNISSIIAFYKEPIFIVTNEKNINSINKLSDMKINIGPPHSGLAETAKTILHSFGIAANIRQWDTKMSKKLLYKHRLQAVFLNHIEGEIEDKIKNRELFIVPIPREFIYSLKKTFQYFNPYSYKIDDFDTITTLSTSSMLVGSNDINEEKVKEIITILEKNYNKLIFPKDSKIIKKHFIDNPLTNWHAGAQKYFLENNMDTSDSKKIDLYIIYLVVSILIILILISIIVLYILNHADIFHRYSSTNRIIKSLHKLYNYIVKNKYLFLLSVIILIYIVCAFLIKYFEHQWAVENDVVTIYDNLSFSKSLSWLFVFGSSGYNGDIFPNSSEGQLIASTVPLLGVGGIFAFVGLITLDHLKKHFLEANGMVKKRVKNHIILCGWNSNSHFTIENLLHKNIVNKRQIVILANEMYENDIKKNIKDPMHIFYVKGEATNKEDLDKANLAEADIAIVISDDKDEHDPDPRVILKVLTVEKYSLELEEQGKRVKRTNIHTIAEISNPQNISIAKDAGVDQIISLGNIESKIFTQAIVNPGVAVFINEILTYNDQNDIYSFEVEKNSKLINKNYDEILLDLREFNILLLSINVGNRRRKKETEEIVLKNNLSTQVITNPLKKSDKEYRVQEGDLIIVLAQYESTLLDALEKLRIKS